MMREASLMKCFKVSSSCSDSKTSMSSSVEVMSRSLKFEQIERTRSLRVRTSLTSFFRLSSDN